MIYKSFLGVLSYTLLLRNLSTSINIPESIIISYGLVFIETKKTSFTKYGLYSLVFSDVNCRIALLYKNLEDLKYLFCNLVNIILISKYEIGILLAIGLMCLVIQYTVTVFGQYVKNIPLDYLDSFCRQSKNTKIKLGRSCMKKPKSLKIIKKNGDFEVSQRIYLLLHLRRRRMLIQNIYYNELIDSKCVLIGFLLLFKLKLEENLLYFLEGLLKVIQDDIFLTNIHRKIFHMFVYIVFFNPTTLKIQLAEFGFFILMLLAGTRTFKMFFKSFLSQNDKGPVVLSHVYIIAAVLFPYYLLSYDNYILNLTSICIYDSLTSLSGTLLRKRSKSFTGSITALILTLIFSKIFLKNYNFSYFICTALVERAPFLNDNISIPLFSILYFKLASLMNSNQ